MMQSESHIAKTILEKRGEYICKVADKIEKDFTTKYSRLLQTESTD